MSFVDYENKGAYSIITINNPSQLNALNSQVLDDLNAALDQIGVETVRAVIVTGSGAKAFVAGADITEMKDLNAEQGEAFGKKGNDIFRRIETFPIPFIAAVNGFALGEAANFPWLAISASALKMQCSVSRKWVLVSHLVLVEHRDLPALFLLAMQSR